MDDDQRIRLLNFGLLLIHAVLLNHQCPPSMTNILATAVPFHAQLRISGLS